MRASRRVAGHAQASPAAGTWCRRRKRGAEMQRVGLREQSTIAFLLTFDVLWGIVAYLLAFVIRIHVPLPFTADFLPGSRVYQLRHMLPQLLVAELVILYFFGFYDLRAL